MAESLFSSLKKERIKKHVYPSREHALVDVFAYIEDFYNSTRRHSYIGGISPEQFEAATSYRGAMTTKGWELQYSFRTKDVAWAR